MIRSLLLLQFFFINSILQCVINKNDWILNYDKFNNIEEQSESTCGLDNRLYLLNNNGHYYLNNSKNSLININSLKKQQIVSSLNYLSDFTNKNQINLESYFHHIETICLFPTDMDTCKNVNETTQFYNDCLDILNWFNNGLSKQKYCENIDEIDKNEVQVYKNEQYNFCTNVIQSKSVPSDIFSNVYTEIKLDYCLSVLNYKNLNSIISDTTTEEINPMLLTTLTYILLGSIIGIMFIILVCTIVIKNLYDS
jgi:hypothetical protein